MNTAINTQNYSNESMLTCSLNNRIDQLEKTQSSLRAQLHQMEIAAIQQAEIARGLRLKIKQQDIENSYLRSTLEKITKAFKRLSQS